MFDFLKEMRGKVSKISDRQFTFLKFYLKDYLSQDSCDINQWNGRDWFEINNSNFIFNRRQ